MDGQKIAKYWWVFLLIVVFLLRLPSLFEPFTYGDEGIYLTLGQALRKGLTWYRDIHDNKPPMLYLMAAIAGNFSTYRLIFFGWSLVTILAFYHLAKLVFQKESAQAIATIAFAILSSLHFFEGNVANAENFMLLPTILAFYLLLKQKAWPLIGLLFGLATLFKVPAGFDFAAAWFFLLLKMRKETLRPFVLRTLLLGAGFLGIIGLTFVYYFYQGALSDYLTAAFSQNIPYLSSWLGEATQTGGLPLALIGRSLLVLGLVGLLWVWREKMPDRIKLILLWFAFSLFAALLSSRPYPHYLVQLLPPLALSFGFLRSGLKRARILPAFLVFVFFLAFFGFNFWHYPGFRYYANFYQFAFGLKNRDAYFDSFDPQARGLYQTADYLLDKTEANEKIFIWGTQPSLYALIWRSPVGRYAASYHIIDFNGYQETIAALENEWPDYLLVSLDETRPFPDLESFIQQHYALETQIQSFKIFHRLAR